MKQFLIPYMRQWLAFLIIVLSLISGYLSHSPSNHSNKEAGPSPHQESKELLESRKNDFLKRMKVLEHGLIGLDFPYMGSLIQIRLEAASLEQAKKALDFCVLQLFFLENQLSSWKPFSEISRLNQNSGIRETSLSTETFEILEISKDLHQQTDGMFDITIGPLWDLWPFRNPARRIPNQAEITQNLALVGSQLLELNRESQTAYLPKQGMRVNLGAIGKGYAALKTVQWLSDFGIESSAVSAGGDLYLGKAHKGGKWKVHIENPQDPLRALVSFYGSELAVATSGNSQRFIVHEGKKYGHILDPHTGNPGDSFLSVTVVCQDPVQADAFATALFAMNRQKAMQWLELRKGVEALMITTGFEVLKSSGMDRILEGTPVQGSEQKMDRSQILQGGNEALDEVYRQLLIVQADFPMVMSRDPMHTVSSGFFMQGRANRKVYLDEFYISPMEVTNSQYATFLQSSHTHLFCHPQEPKGKDHTPAYFREYRSEFFRHSPAGKLAPFDAQTFRQPDHPVVGVDYWDAWAYANWSGGRLPDSLEWEKAARGPDGNIWPWGNEFRYRNVNSGGEKWGEKDGYIYSAPVNSFAEGCSFYGLYHMAGNVSEWSADGFSMGGSSRGNPTQVAGFAKVRRDPSYRAFDLGFRIAGKRLRK